MKNNVYIILTILFGLFNSCNQKSQFNKVSFTENNLFGHVKSIETKTYKNDTLKSREIEIFNESGVVDKSETHFEPNLSSIERLYEYDKDKRLVNEIFITNGDTTFTNSYIYNNLGLIKNEEYYLKELHSVTDFKMDSLGQIIEKNFKYVDSDGLRTFKFYYPDSTTTIVKEFLREIPDKITETKIYPRENKKVIVVRYIFPESESKEIFYFNSLGNLIKKEKYYNQKKTETNSFTYVLDSNQNWIKMESELIRKERIIKYYNE